ncbi:MAG: amino acid ABC transporter permease [Trichodesmium sp. St16_bin4-tuft]|nr:amino acid ABC transporter permease [Trichodesmium sp. St5_bin8]MDE5090834.1 amino acid ABC transporter permease [Trichodesmium sp. St18_bin3_1_1]MDE5097709.1 amino acid ABC transporter permease [Trichodesmium sp. St16_bin4-tuft]MDE5102144.1 amino acid ABC transporter permease [Trichodesmium sp. St19_bin2]
MKKINTNEFYAPPFPENNAIKWLRENFFSTWYNTLLSLILFSLILWGVINFISWAKTEAEWQVIKVNLPLLMVGRYPRDQYWRIWVIVGIISSLFGFSWGVIARNSAQLFTLPVLIGIAFLPVIILIIPVNVFFKLLLLGMVILVVATAWTGKKLSIKNNKLGKYLSFYWLIAFILIVWLIGGGLGLKSVSTNDWGGLMLTVLMAIVSIFLSFPLGVLLALGRQSTLPVIRIFSIGYIEIIRGLPLISILFMGQILIPLFLPDGMRPDRIFRAILGLTLFSAAYLAENVRGGLQSVLRGQSEAAKALGLNTPLSLGLIVLPQALKVAIPSIVGQFISLFQDTTLLSIVGLVELLGISRSILAQPEFLGDYAEVYLFDGIIFWIVCYAMSVGSRQLEKKLNTTN